MCVYFRKWNGIAGQAMAKSIKENTEKSNAIPICNWSTVSCLKSDFDFLTVKSSSSIKNSIHYFRTHAQIYLKQDDFVCPLAFHVIVPKLFSPLAFPLIVPGKKMISYLQLFGLIYMFVLF